MSKKIKTKKEVSLPDFPESKMVAMAEIAPYPKNAKEHSEEQVKRIADSIEKFGFNQPLVIDKKGIIIVGHGRYMAALELGLKEVPAIRLALPDQLARAYRLLDNKLNESPWDMKLVIEEIQDLKLPELEIFGLGDLEIDEGFALPDGAKAPFQQMTFTLSDDQAEIVEECLAKAKKDEAMESIETYGNENSNGNALFLICLAWSEQNKSS